MSRRQVNPLRAMTSEEQASLGEISRATSVPAAWAVRAKMLLAVSVGATYEQAAAQVGRKSGDAVSHLVARFNEEGVAAVEPHHGGGFRVQYGEVEKARILQEFRREPEREQDGTATWSLTTLQRTLRQAEDGLPQVSTATILSVLYEAGYSWQRSRSWSQTGRVIRKRKRGKVVVTDPDGEAKKSH